MWAERIQDAVQRALRESTAAREMCARLAGRSLRIEVRHTPFRATLRSDGHTLHVALREHDAGAVDVIVSGSPPALLAMSGARRRELVAAGVVTIEGDSELAEQYVRLLQLLRPDLETLLAGVLGRAPAHAVTSGARAALTQGGRVLANLAASAVDYLAHERHELLTNAEAQQFYRQVDELQARVARLDAELAARQAGAPR
jgi:ubiquinone biosynthesis protein UbiJ